MNFLLAIPFEVRLLLLFVLGASVCSLANLAIYRLAWKPRSISPWSGRDPKAPPRRPTDRVPIVGWLGLRREAELHGPGFWVRPMLLEVCCGVGFAVLYAWEIGQQGLLPPDAPRFAQPGLQTIFHAQFAAHAVLIALMLVASVIDVDEKTIPDSITVPGTLLGLLLAASFPWSLLPDLVAPINNVLRPGYWNQVSVVTWEILQPASPESPPPDWLALFPAARAWAPQGIREFAGAGSLAAGLGCWWLWCVALMPRTWYPRHGAGRALRLCLARVAREPVTYKLLLMGLIGSAAGTAVWFHGGPAWTGLFSGLVGMAAGGGVIWMVRVIGTAVLKREAMGFGDVTLMAMIGAFLGWQTCLIIFFLAPFAALAVGIGQWVLRRDNVIPYGPFLCLATVATVVRWADLWDRTWSTFKLGWIVPVLILACMAMLGSLLMIWRSVRGVLR